MTKKLSIILIALLFGGESLMAGNNYENMNKETILNQQVLITTLDESRQLLNNELSLLQRPLKIFNDVTLYRLPNRAEQKETFKEIFYRTLRLVAIAETSSVNYNEREQAIDNKIKQINEGFRHFDSFIKPITGNKSNILKRNVLCDISFAKEYFDGENNNDDDASFYDAYDVIFRGTLSLSRDIKEYVKDQLGILTKEIDLINLAIMSNPSRITESEKKML